MHSEPTTRRRAHVFVILGCLGLLGVAAALEAHGDHVELFGYELGRTCWVPGGCPGCGLTRGVVSMLAGDVSAAVSYHPGSLVAVFLVFFELVFRLQGARGLSADSEAAWERWERYGFRLLLSICVLVWIGRFFQ
ncbi:MAG: DUF2752 domain-containing protein [Planctomycetota bacterium]